MQISDKNYITLVAVIFAIIAALHLARLIYGWPGVIGRVEIPMWASWAAVTLAGALSLYGFAITRK